MTGLLLHLPDGRQQVVQLTRETVALSYAQQAADCDTDADAHQVWHQARRALGLPGTIEARIAWDCYVAAAADVAQHDGCDLGCTPCLEASGRGHSLRAVCDGWTDALLAGRDDALRVLVACTS